VSLLGLDVGGNGCRALVISLQGGVLANVGRGYGGADPPGCELEVRRIWTAVADALQEAAARTTGDPITAMAISSVGEAITPLGRDGVVLASCLLGGDPRGGGEVARLVKQLGAERVHDITGRAPERSHTLAKLCWLRENEPALYRETWRFALLGGLVAHLLGGSSVCDYSLAGSTLCLDMRQRAWSREVLGACGLSPAKLPELAPAGTPIGTISPRVARELELPAGITLVLGGHDLACNALGAGAVGSGLAALDLGASAHLTPVFHAVPLVSMLLREGLSLEYHVVPDLLLTDCHVRVGGNWLRWFANRLAPLEQRESTRRGISLYRTLLDEMPAEPTPLLALPPLFDPEASPGALLGLTLETERGELVKGMLEGTLMHLARGMEQLERSGIAIERCRATGGGARSEGWVQLCADVLDRPVERTRTEHAAPLGAALLAGVGSGLFSDATQAAEALVQVERSFAPHARRTRIYAERLALYRELRTLLQEPLTQLGAGS
jgi:xylulokinase